MNHETIELYADRSDVTLTSYVLDDSPEILDGRRRGAVLVCPGGGYLGCSDREAEPVALRFAAMGYHAFVLRYSTYYGTFKGGFQAGEMSGKKETMHPAPVRDIARAFLTIGEHAEEWLVDMDKITICGFSAGAHNCAMYSVYWDTPLITDFFGKGEEHFRPAAAILAYGISDYRLLYSSHPDRFVRELRTASAMALLGTAEPGDELLDEVSPVLRVSDSTPPTFIWATSEDRLVPAENSISMAAALARAGVPYEMHLFESGMHGLSLADRSTGGNMMMIDSDAAQWIGLAERWLEKRMACALPSTPAWMEEMQQ
jgi:acetyl esterase/lipase